MWISNLKGGAINTDWVKCFDVEPIDQYKLESGYRVMAVVENTTECFVVPTEEAATEEAARKYIAELMGMLNKQYGDVAEIKHTVNCIQQQLSRLGRIGGDIN